VIAHLDARLIARAEQFAHAFQRATGRTSFFLARTSLAFAGCGLLTQVFNYYNQLVTRPSDALDVVLCTAFVVLYVVPYFEAFKRLDARQDYEVLPAWVAIVRGNGAWTRMITVAIAAVQLGVGLAFMHREHAKALYLLLHSNAMGLALFDYFAMVDPLPPCRGYLWEKVNVGRHAEVKL
jgi:hypothetical protein